VFESLCSRSEVRASDGVTVGDGALFEVHSESGCYVPVASGGNGGVVADLRVVSRLLMKSLYEGVRPVVRFAPHVFRYLFGGVDGASGRVQMQCSMRDLELVDGEQARNLQMLLLDRSMASRMSLSFSEFGDGADERVVDEWTVDEYVGRRIAHVLVERRRAELDALRAGVWEAFADAVPHLRVVRGPDMERLLSGLREIRAADVLDVLEFGDDADGAVAQVRVTECVAQLSEDELRRLVKFVTGQEALPVLNPRHDAPAPRDRIRVRVRGGELGANACPQAHVCFFWLDIGREYDSEAVFLDRMRTALASFEGSGFQLA
jgi:hypothetical protein